MTWSLTATGDIKNLAGKALEDLERELFDAAGPILARYGAFASHFAGHHITGAPHQTTSDAAAPAGTQPAAGDSSMDTSPAHGVDTSTVTTTAPDPAQTGTPFATGGIITGPDGADSIPASLQPGEAYLPAPATPVDPPAADVPLPQDSTTS